MSAFDAEEVRPSPRWQFRLAQVHVVVLIVAVLCGLIRFVAGSMAGRVMVGFAIVFGSVMGISMALCRLFDRWMPRLQRRIARAGLLVRCLSAVGLFLFYPVAAVLIAVTSFLPAVVVLYMMQRVFRF